LTLTSEWHDGQIRSPQIFVTVGITLIARAFSDYFGLIIERTAEHSNRADSKDVELGLPG
jgi:hypothetical protein